MRRYALLLKRMCASAFPACLLFSLVTALPGASFCQSGPNLSAMKDVNGAVVPIVCLVRARNGRRVSRYRPVGTGFLVDTSGTFVTASHVLATFSDNTKGNGCRAAIAFSPSRQRAPSTEHWTALPASEWESASKDINWFQFDSAGCYKNNKLDLAVCKTIRDLTAEPIPHQAVSVSPARPAVGTRVFFIGFGREGLDTTSISAVVTGSSATENSFAIEIDKSAWPGASGSPIFAADGKSVLGLITRTGIGDTSGKTFGVACDAITAVLAEAKPK